MRLDNPSALIAVDDKAGKAIAFAEKRAVSSVGVSSGSVENIAGFEGALDTRAEKVPVYRFAARARKEADRDQGARIHESGSQIAPMAVEYIDKPPRLDAGENFGIGQFVAENPGMALLGAFLGMTVQRDTW